MFRRRDHCHFTIQRLVCALAISFLYFHEAKMSLFALTPAMIRNVPARTLLPTKLYSSISTTGSALSFQPSEPPGTKGTPVFPNIDFSVAGPEGQRRKEDPEAVMVVTGANRGIGLEFVKSLVYRSKVRMLRFDML